MKTITELAEEMLKNFEVMTRENNSKFWALKNRIDWQVEVCRKAHGERMPSDEVYDVIVEALEVIADADDYNDAQDNLYEQLQSDSYNWQLTEWLNSHALNLYYLDEAIEDGANTGFGILSQAQCLWKQEIASAVLEALNELED